MESQLHETPSWLDKPLASFLPKLNLETALAVVILIVTVFTRFYNVDARVMSHDEVNHVVPAFSLYRGQGYAYDPVTHGPLQFHLLALSYFVLGDSDFSARVPAVLFSIATVALALFGFRRYLGRSGALLAGLLMMISPYMLFYGRYTRNEAFGGLWTVLMIYGALRYLEKGDKKSLYFLTVVMAFHFTDKATSYIYNAQFMLFLGFVFLANILRLFWLREEWRGQFWHIVEAAGVAVLLLGATLVVAVATAGPVTETTAGEISPFNLWRLLEIALIVAAGGAVLYAVVLVVRNLGWATIRKQRSFDLIMLAGTLTLPTLAALPMRMLGLDPLDYSSTGMAITSAVLVVLTFMAVALGLWWRPRFWLGAAGIFFAIFTVFYTTFFTNGKGFFMGLVAALGYWLSQQGVQRGSQPLYYYALIQIPIYEYLPFIGLILGFVIAWRRRLFSHFPGYAPAHQPEPVGEEPVEWIEEKIEPVQVEKGQTPDGENPTLPTESRLQVWLREVLTPQTTSATSEVEDDTPQRVPVFALLLFWSLSSLLAYSLAGEKMPWLTVHITAAMILGAGWSLGYLVDTTPWKELARRRGLIAALLLPVFVSAAIGFTLSLLGTPGPFTGQTMEQLNATSNFIMGLVGAIASGAGLFYLLSSWNYKNVLRLILLAIFGLMGVLTARAAFMASYINYDLGSEFLVYAHAARGPKDVLAQVEEISKRTTRGLDIAVAYDNESLYPYWWYFRNYPNKKYFADKPTRDVRESPVIIIGDPNYSKIDPILKDNSYVMYEYMRLVWPMQDYFDLTPKRVWDAITNPVMRQALFNIWLNRDYALYAQATGSTSLTPETWSPAARLRLYIRKDVVAMMWNYGAVPTYEQTPVTDPYEKGMVRMAYDRLIGTPGTAVGQFNAPRGVAVAADGSIYVADSRNHRIQHLAPDGKILQVWGTFGETKGTVAPPPGTFNEPWGVAVGKDGSVYVTDTWNHRVQKFTADGKFLLTWGSFSQDARPEAFWGPRGIAVDGQGRVFVVDTGNKRIAIFGPNGEPISYFGSAGMDVGQFDEQVAVAFDREGRVYITDTWNQRVQVFQADVSGTSFTPLWNWTIDGWMGQSLDNKPFIAVDADGNVYVTDPEAGRVLQFDTQGKFLRGWSSLIGENLALVMPSGLAIDRQGGLWVSDAGAQQILHFNLLLAPLAPQTVPLLPVPQEIQPTPTGSVP
jgi:predicted membrane-bound mannosyltransferase/DNA-binding beta-propeller fold protein YncE